MDGKNQNPDAPATQSDLKPGDAVSFRAGSDAGIPLPNPTELPEPVFGEAASPGVATGMESEDPGANSDDQADLAESNEPEVTWTASEFIAHDKSPVWYVGLAGVTLVGLVAAYFFTHHDIVTLVVIVICAGLFGYMASREPRQLQYSLANNGIFVGSKFYPYSGFRSFSVVLDGAFASIDFAPLKRFALPLSVYCDPEHEQNVVELLSRHLPIADHQRTAVDGLMHRVRF